MTMTDQFPASRSSSAFKQAIVGGYDRDEVDEYVARLERRIEELERARTPDGALQRRLEQVGDEVAGILQRAHETADQLTQSARTEANQLLESARSEAEKLQESSQREAAERLEAARREADERIGASHRDSAQITANAHTRLQELDVDADRIWAERERILADVRFLSQQLDGVVQAATERFPSDEVADDTEEVAGEAPHELAGDVTHELPGEVTQEVALLPGELGAMPEEGELPEDAEDEEPGLAEGFEGEGLTQAFDVEELFHGPEPSLEDTLPGEPRREASPEDGEGPEFAGD
jgi:DivIVA domain-containing protein